MESKYLERKCMGIINQLFDLAEISVEKRQEINDIATSYLEERIKEIIKDVTGTIGSHFIESDKYFNEKLVFDNFRKLYPGTKRGNDTEFENFIKKHKDWKVVLPHLVVFLNYQIAQKQYLKDKNKFCAEWKNMQTYINNRSWEEQYCVIPVSQPKQPIQTEGQKW